MKSRPSYTAPKELTNVPNAYIDIDKPKEKNIILPKNISHFQSKSSFLNLFNDYGWQEN